MKSTSTIVHDVYKRHIRLYRDLNDIQIFVSQIVPFLKNAAEEYRGKFVNSKEDITIVVPGKRARSGVANRNATELSVLFKRYANEELYSNLLVTSVSKFETYLSDVMAEFLWRAPKKLTVGPKGGDSKKEIPIQLAVESKNLPDLFRQLIELRLQVVFHAEPKEYCNYFNAISELGILEEQFQPFFEIKASRDLIVHNSLEVNELYLKKAGPLSRGSIGERLKIRKSYFEAALSTMKTLSSNIEKQTRGKYGKDYEIAGELRDFR
ncbi:MAG: hypothetical protein Q8M16_19560 [Pirellulaceae bacterium]|nr:hypothetical protein [Pirellulaceae bacterium]